MAGSTPVLKFLEDAPDILNFSYKENNIAHILFKTLIPWGGDTPIAWGVAVFSSGLCFLLIPYLFWQIMMTTVDAASRGKTFEDEVSWVHAPIRLVFGIGGLVPIPTIGWSVAHFLVFGGLFFGSNLADNGHNVLVEYQVVQAKPLNEFGSYRGRDIALKIIESEVCTGIVNATRGIANEYVDGTALERADAVRPVETGTIDRGVVASAVDYIAFWRQKEKVEDAERTDQSRYWRWGRNAECGSISFEEIAGYNEFSKKRNAAIDQTILSIQKDISPFFRQLDWVSKAHSNNKKSMLESAEKYIQSGMLPNNFAHYLNQKGNELSRALSTAASEAQADRFKGERERVANAMKQYGWMSYPLPTRMNAQTISALHNLVNEEPVRNGPAISAPYDEHYNLAMDMLRTTIELDRVEVSANDFAAVGDDSASWITRQLAPMTRSVSARFLAFVSESTILGLGQGGADPEGGMVNLGENLITSAMLLKAASIAIEGNFITKVVNKIPLVGSYTQQITDAVGTFVNLVFWPLIAVGILYAHILPALPLLMSIVAIGAWIIIAAEAILAAPLFAFALPRLKSNGSLLDEQSKPFIHLLVNAILRPIIIVLIFAITRVTIPVSLGILNLLWSIGWPAQTGGAINILSAPIGIVLHAWTSYQLIMRQAVLTITAPNRILLILGIHSADMHEASDMSAFAAGAATAASVKGFGGGRGGGGGGGNKAPEGDGIKKGVKGALNKAGTAASVAGPKGAAVGAVMKGVSNQI